MGKKPMKKGTRIALMIATDLVVFACALFIYAYFHHVRPVNPVALASFSSPTPAPSATAEPVVASTATPDPDAPTPVPTETPAPTPWGLLGGKYAEKFTDGQIEQGENYYRSKYISVEVTRHEGYHSVYYVADIYVQDIRCFATALSDDPSMNEYPLEIAGKNNAILATNADNVILKKIGFIVRNGQLYYEDLSVGADLCVLYYDGTMETYLAGEIDLEAIKAANPYQSWYFGPVLLDNGMAATTFNSRVKPENPRTAIGYYEPGHYCLLVADGRQSGYSTGIKMSELAEIFASLGCTAAYNLDGGESSTMVFMDAVANQPYKNGRPIADIVYVRDLTEEEAGQ